MQSDHKIFIIAGESGAGKTTCASFIKNYYELITTNTKIVMLAFADDLKQFTANMLNNFYNPMEKFDHASMNASEYKEKIRSEYTFRGQELTVRNALIDIGMSLREINPDIWVDSVINKIKLETESAKNAQCIFIIHDNRFLNETKKIFALPGYKTYGLRIVRDRSVQQHNETEIDKIAKDYNYEIISNNNSYNDIYRQIVEKIHYC